MAKFKKVIAVIAVMATVATCFTGCGTAKEETSSKAKTESSVSQEEEKEEKNEESEVKEEEKAPAADIPSDYKLPATPEVIVYQGGQEIFRYAGETTADLKAKLEGMGFEDNGGYKIVKDGQRLTVGVYEKDVEIDVNKLADDMRVVVDGLEINLDTMNALAPETKYIQSDDKSGWTKEELNSIPNSFVRFVTNSNTGKMVGCIIHIANP